MTTEFYERKIMEFCAGKIAARLYRLSGGNRPVEEIAYHEAGHTILGRHFGKNAVLIEITPKGGVTHFAWNSAQIEPLADDEIIDICHEFHAAAGGSDSELDQWELEFSTELILREKWGKVELLAANLISQYTPDNAGNFHMTLSASAISEILK